MMDPLRSTSLNNLNYHNPPRKSAGTKDHNSNNNSLTDIKPKSSGKVSSLRRQWSSITPQSTVKKVPSTKFSSSQPDPSSEPSWKADESEWPSSPPPAKKVKSTNSSSSASHSNRILHQNNLIGPASTIRYPPAQTVIRSSFNQDLTSRSLPGPKSKKSETDLKRPLPWDVTRNPKTHNTTTSKKSTAFNQLAGVGKHQANASIQSHLTNPNISIAAKVSLSPEQQNVLDSVVNGQSVFFTGSAGTGKSVLLRHIISALKRNYASRPDAVAITASTGMAACAIGGTTIHSFAGIGLGIEAPDILVKKVKRNRKAAGKWMRTKVLIIDEISMVDGELFDKLAHIAQKMKKSDKPFGGIQLVIAGDFFQLPPVSKTKTSFAFNAEQWSDCIPQTINLTQVFRQKDSTFIDMLNEMRMGELSSASIKRFHGLARELKFDDGIAPTELYPTRHEVERSNTLRLNALKSEQVIYDAIDSGKAPLEQRTRDLSNLMAVPRLILKKDAQVMMIKNLVGEDGPNWLVNGLVGRVLDFVDSGTSLQQYLDERHKDSNFNLEGIFSDEEGRVPSAQPPLRGAAKSKAESQKPDAPPVKPRSLLPVVEWFLMNGKREVTIIERAEFKVENMEGEVMSRRVQIPLILAWAMSIHKSQGQTLQRVKVDLGKVFEKGQIYVALSRATSLDGLQVLRFDPKKVMAHPEVIEWSKKNLISHS